SNMTSPGCSPSLRSPPCCASTPRPCIGSGATRGCLACAWVGSLGSIAARLSGGYRRGRRAEFMPKLPRGMFRRGGSYCTRVYRGGADRWISLGPDYGEACRRFRAIDADSVPLGRFTVAQTAKRWTESYIRDNRVPSGQRDVAARV